MKMIDVYSAFLYRVLLREFKQPANNILVVT